MAGRAREEMRWARAAATVGKRLSKQSIVSNCCITYCGLDLCVRCSGICTAVFRGKEASCRCISKKQPELKITLQSGIVYMLWYDISTPHTLSEGWLAGCLDLVGFQETNLCVAQLPDTTCCANCSVSCHSDLLHCDTFLPPAHCLLLLSAHSFWHPNSTQMGTFLGVGGESSDRVWWQLKPTNGHQGASAALRCAGSDGCAKARRGF